MIVLFAGRVYNLSGFYDDESSLAFAFRTPVSQTFGGKSRSSSGRWPGATSLDPSPPMDSDLALVQGADVLLVFLESYGAVS